MGKFYDYLRHVKAMGVTMLHLPKYLKIMDEAHEKGNLRYLSDADYKSWRDSFRAMLCHTYLIRSELMPQYFAAADIKTLHKSSAPLKPDDLVCVVVAKDVLTRLQLFVEHGRKIGVDRFAILDNGSGQEVLDWLTAQPDVDLYHTDEAFQTIRKDSWVNRILSLYGRNRWYLQLDTDELPVYFGMETHSVKDVIKWLEGQNLTCAKGIMLDMFAKEKLFHDCPTPDSIRENFPYFDPTTFFDVKTFGIPLKKGGPRTRLFGYPQMLAKHPLYYLGDIGITIDSHFQWPYRSARVTPYIFGLLHYKYIDADRDEFLARAKKGNFASGSAAYKAFSKYYAEHPDMTLYSENSARYEGIESLKKVGFIRDVWTKGEKRP